MVFFGQENFVFDIVIKENKCINDHSINNFIVMNLNKIFEKIYDENGWRHLENIKIILKPLYQKVADLTNIGIKFKFLDVPDCYGNSIKNDFPDLCSAWIKN